MNFSNGIMQIEEKKMEKRMNRQYDGPLDELVMLTAVAYISDLRTLHYELIRRQLKSVKPEKYTLAQWKDAAMYLTGKNKDLGSVEEIYAYLLKY